MDSIKESTLERANSSYLKIVEKQDSEAAAKQLANSNNDRMVGRMNKSNGKGLINLKGMGTGPFGKKGQFVAKSSTLVPFQSQNFKGQQATGGVGQVQVGNSSILTQKTQSDQLPQSSQSNSNQQSGPGLLIQTSASVYSKFNLNQNSNNGGPSESQSNPAQPTGTPKLRFANPNMAGNDQNQMMDNMNDQQNFQMGPGGGPGQQQFDQQYHQNNMPMTHNQQQLVLPLSPQNGPMGQGQNPMHMGPNHDHNMSMQMQMQQQLQQNNNFQQIQNFNPMGQGKGMMQPSDHQFDQIWNPGQMQNPHTPVGFEHGPGGPQQQMQQNFGDQMQGPGPGMPLGMEPQQFHMMNVNLNDHHSAMQNQQQPNNMQNQMMNHQQNQMHDMNLNMNSDQQGPLGPLGPGPVPQNQGQNQIYQDFQPGMMPLEQHHSHPHPFPNGPMSPQQSQQIQMNNNNMDNSSCNMQMQQNQNLQTNQQMQMVLPIQPTSSIIGTGPFTNIGMNKGGQPGSSNNNQNLNNINNNSTVAGGPGAAPVPAPGPQTTQPAPQTVIVRPKPPALVKLSDTLNKEVQQIKLLTHELVRGVVGTLLSQPFPRMGEMNRSDMDSEVIKEGGVGIGSSNVRLSKIQQQSQQTGLTQAQSAVTGITSASNALSPSNPQYQQGSNSSSIINLSPAVLQQKSLLQPTTNHALNTFMAPVQTDPLSMVLGKGSDAKQQQQFVFKPKPTVFNLKGSEHSQVGNNVAQDQQLTAVTASPNQQQSPSPLPKHRPTPKNGLSLYERGSHFMFHQRIGQSRSNLPDGRVILIGGRHGGVGGDLSHFQAKQQNDNGNLKSLSQTDQQLQVLHHQHLQELQHLQKYHDNVYSDTHPDFCIYNDVCVFVPKQKGRVNKEQTNQTSPMVSSPRGNDSTNGSISSLTYDDEDDGSKRLKQEMKNMIVGTSESESATKSIMDNSQSVSDDSFFLGTSPLKQFHFALYSYPPHLFPPTDYHSATVISYPLKQPKSFYIVIIGNLGYIDQRRCGEIVTSNSLNTGTNIQSNNHLNPSMTKNEITVKNGETPVYVLDCQTYAMRELKLTDESIVASQPNKKENSPSDNKSESGSNLNNKANQVQIQSQPCWLSKHRTQLAKQSPTMVQLKIDRGRTFLPAFNHNDNLPSYLSESDSSESDGTNIKTPLFIANKDAWRLTIRLDQENSGKPLNARWTRWEDGVSV